VTRTTSHDTERRASGSDARRLLWFGLGGFALAGVILGGYALARWWGHTAAPVSAASASAAPPASSNATYGTLPSWLPRATVPVGRVVQASATHPWIGIEGDTVSVDLAGHRVNATLVGPQVPKEGQFPLPKTTPCTFFLTLTNATGQIPISAADLAIFDEQGHRYTPRVRSLTGAAAPTHLGPGQSVTVRLDTILPTGAGEVVWTTNGTAPLVSYEFVTEID